MLETCVNYVTLTAARFQFIHLLVLQVDVYREGISASDGPRTDIGQECPLCDLGRFHSCGKA